MQRISKNDKLIIIIILYMIWDLIIFICKCKSTCAIILATCLCVMKLKLFVKICVPVSRTVKEAHVLSRLKDNYYLYEPKINGRSSNVLFISSWVPHPLNRLSLALDLPVERVWHPDDWGEPERAPHRREVHARFLYIYIYKELARFARSLLVPVSLHLYLNT